MALALLSSALSFLKDGKPDGDEIEIPTTCWTEQVPELVLSIVCRKLGVIKDLLAFGSVCSLWNRVFKDWRRQIAASMPPVLFMADKGSFYDLTAPGGRGCSSLVISQWYQGLKIAPRQRTANFSHGYLLLLSQNSISLINPFSSDQRYGTIVSRDKAAAFNWASLTSHITSPDCVLCVVGPGRRVVYTIRGKSRPHVTTLPRSGCPLSAAVFQDKLYVLTDEFTIVCYDLVTPKPMGLIYPLLNADHSLKNRTRYLVADPDGGGDGQGQLLLVRNDSLPPYYLFSVCSIMGPSASEFMLVDLGGRNIFLDKWSGIIWKPPTTAPTHVVEEGGISAGGGISRGDDDGSARPLRDCIVFINSRGVLCVFRMKDETVEELPYSITEETPYSWVLPELCYFSDESPPS